MAAPCKEANDNQNHRTLVINLKPSDFNPILTLSPDPYQLEIVPDVLKEDVIFPRKRLNVCIEEDYVTRPLKGHTQPNRSFSSKFKAGVFEPLKASDYTLIPVFF
jgi:hypothetical protein